jgi:hypothetical protein
LSLAVAGVRIGGRAAPPHTSHGEDDRRTTIGRAYQTLCGEGREPPYGEDDGELLDCGQVARARVSACDLRASGLVGYSAG